MSLSQTIDKFCIGVFAAIVSGGMGTEAGVMVVPYSGVPSQAKIGVAMLEIDTYPRSIMLLVLSQTSLITGTERMNAWK